jgi:hypothetical protein
MYHQYGGVRAQLCKLQIDSQPQVIKFTSCLPMSQWFSPGTPASVHCYFEICITYLIFFFFEESEVVSIQFRNKAIPN